jgi:riboflavin kinase/FMN adenylyltransferase
MAISFFGKDPSKDPSVLTFGNFDGVHLGHQEMFSYLKTLAKRQNLSTCVLTFNPHPATILSSHQPKPLILSLKNRIRYILEQNIDTVAVMDFDARVSEWSADEFCEYLKETFQIKGILMGYNLNYGAYRKGNVSHMQTFAQKEEWDVWTMPEIFTQGQSVSSSHIRRFITFGHMESAAEFLGRPFSLEGKVVRGDGRGKVLGFPTANLEWEEELLPPRGVYSVSVERESGERLVGVMNCGVRPTATQGRRFQVETYILDFNEEIYGEHIRYHILKNLRPEIQFSSLEHLKSQITKDIERVRKEQN